MDLLENLSESDNCVNSNQYKKHEIFILIIITEINLFKIIITHLLPFQIFL